MMMMMIRMMMIIILIVIIITEPLSLGFVRLIYFFPFPNGSQPLYGNWLYFILYRKISYLFLRHAALIAFLQIPEWCLFHTSTPPRQPSKG